jgi:hypothetical protein
VYVVWFANTLLCSVHKRAGVRKYGMAAPLPVSVRPLWYVLLSTVLSYAVCGRDSRYGAQACVHHGRTPAGVQQPTALCCVPRPRHLLSPCYVRAACCVQGNTKHGTFKMVKLVPREQSAWHQQHSRPVLSVPLAPPAPIT